MDPRLIALLVFIIALVIIAIFYRKATLEKLPALAGERVLFEEEGIRVEQSGSPRSVLFTKSTVRVTDRRIIIAQATLIGKTRVLRHVISYDAPGNETDLSASAHKGYLVMSVRKSQVNISPESGAAAVRINIPESLLTGGQYITYKTARGGEYMKIFA